jgi:hypothetical protein
MRIIYESKRPKFAILVDRYQWIVAMKKKKVKRKIYWTDKSYYPTLGILLDDLAETLFRKNVKKVKELSELSKVIDRVYKIIDRANIDLKRK